MPFRGDLGPRRLTAACFYAAATFVAAALVVVIVWAIATLGSRPLFGEGEALFEASRIRAGLPLYTDPVRGAADYGSVPSHYYVLYTPLWPALLALVPSPHVAAMARAFDTAAWLGILALFAGMARRRQWHPAVLLAGYFAGNYHLVIFAASARHDMLAVAFAGLGLARSLRARRVDALAGALFAIGAWVKPNVIGLAAGAFVAQAMSAPGALLPGVAGAVVAAGGCAAGVQRASNGEWLVHLFRSTAQPLTLAEWLDCTPGNLAWFGAPVAWALAVGSRDRHPASRIAFGALAASTAWALFLGAKTGSASNYWLEPCVAAVAMGAVAPWPQTGGTASLVVAVMAVIQSSYVGAASIRSVLDSVSRDRIQRELTEDARAVCRTTGGVVLSDDTGVQLDLDGRIVLEAYQFAHLVRAGRLPKELILSVVEHPDVTCYLEHSGILRAVPAVDAAIDRNFVLRTEAGEWRFFMRRLPLRLAP